MQEIIGKKVYPGTRVNKYEGQKFGYGLYLLDDVLYASVFGNIHKEGNVFTVVNKLPQKKVGICVGDIVYGKVIKVKEEQCNIEVMQINNVPCQCQRSIEGTIRKENVREKMIDSVVMVDCFRPRDIVKGKVISLGDSIRSVYISTGGEDLGVLVAQHEQTGKVMLPYDWDSMVDVENSLKEKRKVCRPEM